MPAIEYPREYPRSSLAAYEARRRSTAVAYLLWFFLGLVGAHRFYAGETRSAVAMLLMQLLGGLSMVAGVLRSGTMMTMDGPGIGSVYATLAPDSETDLLIGLGSLLMGLVWFWWIIDLFLVPTLVRRYNLHLVSNLDMTH